MFETLTLPSLDIMVLTARAVLLLGAFCVFALAFIRWRSADARANAQLSQQLERTFAEVRTLHETVAVMSARLEALSENTEANTRTPPVASAVSPRGYDIAARLAKNGADADALIANCGLTRQEADLMVRLHGAKVASAEPPQRPNRAEPVPARPARELRTANEGRQQPTPRQEARQAEVAAAALRTSPVPVLQVPASDVRAAGGRRRGGLVSMVG